MTIKKRDRLSVIFDILEEIMTSNNSIRFTPLLRQSKLSTKTFSSYYAELLAKDFISENYNSEEKRFVSLTKKGYNYLNKYKTIQGFIQEFEL